MGNSSSRKPKNKLKVRFNIKNFVIHGLPQKPAEWGQRIDERMWNEFVTCVRTAATLDNAEERKIEYKKWYCNFWLGIMLFMIGAGCAIAMGLGGALSNNTVVWAFAIIVGVFGVIGGMLLLIISANRYGEINKEYISDVKSSVSSQLMQLNTKYTNIIRFNVLGTGNNIFKSKEDADTTINIPIEIEILAPTEATVQYIPDQNMIIQQQPPQGQIIMIQMPDGRMVPAQIQKNQTHSRQIQMHTQIQNQTQIQKQSHVPPSVANARTEAEMLHFVKEIETISVQEIFDFCLNIEKMKIFGKQKGILLKCVTNEDLIKMGITNSAQRKLIIKSLQSKALY